MLNIELGNGNTLSVCAEYDSGTFIGFNVGEVDYDSWHTTTLDKRLTKEQIDSITCLIGVSVKRLIDGEKS
jgi:hypothetical protein